MVLSCILTHVEVPVILLARELHLTSVYTIARYELQRWYPPAPKAGNGDIPVAVRSDLFTRADLEKFLRAQGKFWAATQDAFLVVRRAATQRCWQNEPGYDEDGDSVYPPAKAEPTPCVPAMTQWVNRFIADSTLKSRQDCCPPYDALTEVRNMRLSLDAGNTSAGFLHGECTYIGEHRHGSYIL